MGRKKTTIILVLISGLIFATIYAFNNVAYWLFQRDPLPEKLQVICTFAGDSKREKYAFELFQKYKPIWIVSTGKKSWFLLWAKDKGVDTSKIKLYDECQSTWDEINLFNKVLLRLQQQKEIDTSATVGFVSSYYHMRRIMVINSLIKYKSQLKIIALPVPLQYEKLEFLDLKRWWQHKNYRELIVSEIVKMGADILSTTPVIGLWIRGKLENKKE